MDFRIGSVRHASRDHTDGKRLNFADERYARRVFKEELSWRSSVVEPQHGGTSP